MSPRLKRFFRRLGFAGDHVSVRADIPWYWRWLGAAMVFAALAGVAFWTYDAGRRFAGFDRDSLQQELVQTKKRLDGAESELDRLRAVANAADNRLSIERTAQQRLAQQFQGLEQENARLREELATFESMLSSEARQKQGLSIYRFKIEPEVLPGEYRYRLLLLTSGLRRDREFQGRLELVVKLTEDGRSAMMVFPESGQASAAAFKLAFKYFQRVEGTFRVAPRAKVESVQVRVYESGSTEAKAMYTVTL